MTNTAGINGCLVHRPIRNALCITAHPSSFHQYTQFPVAVECLASVTQLIFLNYFVSQQCVSNIRHYQESHHVRCRVPCEPQVKPIHTLGDNNSALLQHIRQFIPLDCPFPAVNFRKCFNQTKWIRMQTPSALVRCGPRHPCPQVLTVQHPVNSFTVQPRTIVGSLIITPHQVLPAINVRTTLKRSPSLRGLDHSSTRFPIELNHILDASRFESHQLHTSI